MDKHKEQQTLLFHENEKNMHAIKETRILQKQWKEKLVCHFLSLIVKHTDFFYVKTTLTFQDLATVLKRNRLE